jgi:hypothetical protein
MIFFITAEVGCASSNVRGLPSVQYLQEKTDMYMLMAGFSVM